jgi:hypothetical protein
MRQRRTTNSPRHKVAAVWTLQHLRRSRRVNDVVEGAPAFIIASVSLISFSRFGNFEGTV